MNARRTETYRSLKQWHSSDPKGMEALLDRHLSWIRIHTRKRMGQLLRQRAETNDYVQDAIVQFLSYGPKVMISDDKHFRALMVRIVENTLRDKHDWYMACRRKVAKERPLPSDSVLSLDAPRSEVERPSQAAQAHENEAWIRLGLEILHPEDREVLVLRQWENLSFVEIGKKLDLTPEAVWKRHHRAMNQLALKVGDLRRDGIESLMEEITENP